MDCPVTARPTVIVISDSLGDTACEVVQVCTVKSTTASPLWCRRYAQFQFKSERYQIQMGTTLILTRRNENHGKSTAGHTHYPDH